MADELNDYYKQLTALTSTENYILLQSEELEKEVSTRLNNDDIRNQEEEENQMNMKMTKLEHIIEEFSKKLVGVSSQI
jgi:hypothetical protein